MIPKVLNIVLMLFTLFFGMSSAIGMIKGSGDLVPIYREFHFSDTVLMIQGALLIVALIMLFFRPTFVLGNMIAIGLALILFILNAIKADGKGALMAIPIIGLHVVILWLRYPFTKELNEEAHQVEEGRPREKDL